MVKRNHWSVYNRAPISLKISLPFILMFLGCWVCGTWGMGEYFSVKLDQRERRHAAESGALLKFELEHRLMDLQRTAHLLATRQKVVQATVDGNPKLLQQEILPLKAILETDVVVVINSHNQALFDLHSTSLNNIELNNQEVNNLLLTGVDMATIVSTQGSNPPILIGTSHIKNDQGIVGGLTVGTVFNDELLTEINESIDEQLIVLSNGEILASTFQSEAENAQAQEMITNGTSQNPDYFAEVISFEGMQDERFDLVLLISTQPLKQAKQSLWLNIFLIATLGAGMTSAIGYWVARKIAQPIQSITHIAKRVVTESNFDLKATVATDDEIGALATSLNQLIEWVKEYTHELEQAAVTLDSKVEERTQELSQALLERQTMQTQLIQTEKMSSLGQMVAGIAHEINNPISFIHGNIAPLQEYFQDLLDLLAVYQAEYPAPSDNIIQKQDAIDLTFVIKDASNLLRSMKTGTNRVKDIVVALRNYSRLDEATVKDVDIHEGIESSLLILNHRIMLGVEIIKDYGTLPPIICSAAQLNQVFTNIIANALDAMLDHDCQFKRLTITTSAVDSEHIQISLKDTGPGIPEQIKAKIFDPFFTTKPIGKGTGLGLGICYKIVEKHAGSMVVNSAEGEGTEFVITLPKGQYPVDELERMDCAIA